MMIWIPIQVQLPGARNPSHFAQNLSIEDTHICQYTPSDPPALSPCPFPLPFPPALSPKGKDRWGHEYETAVSYK